MEQGFDGVCPLFSKANENYVTRKQAAAFLMAVMRHRARVTQFCIIFCCYGGRSLAYPNTVFDLVAHTIFEINTKINTNTE